MARKPSKPAGLTMGPVCAAALRPRPAGGPADGRWYWQARFWSTFVTEDHPKPGQRTVWTGWGTRDEVTAALRELGDPAKAEQAVETATAAPLPDVKSFTVADLLKRWKADIERRRDLPTQDGDHLGVFTVRNYVTRLAQINAGLGTVRLDRIDQPILKGYLARRIKETCAVATLNKEFIVLGAAWKWGRGNGTCPDRSLPRIRLEEKVGVTSVRNRRTPSPADLAAILHKMTGWPRVAVSLLYSTGCRIGEIATLERAAVDLDAGEITVNGKTGPRSVFLPDDAVNELRVWLATSTHRYVIGAPPNVVGGHLWRYIAEACAAAGVARFSPHGLRRAVVGAFMRSGVEVAVAAEHLGHSPAVMLKLYRDVTPEDRRAGVRRAALGALPKAFGA